MPPKQTDRAKLMISIVSPADAQVLTDALSNETRCLHYTFLGKGTAKSHIMDYFGLSGVEKNIVASIIPSSMEKHLLSVATNVLKLYLVGKGIAFTVPLTSVSSLIANAVVTDKVQPKGGRKMAETNASKYDLIVTVYNQEYSDAVLDAAKKAGAVGGTLVHARTLSSSGVEQFVGISISRETEVLMILTKREGRNGIMQAVRDVAGLKTSGGAVVFSLPVDSLVGIGMNGDEYAQVGDKETKD